MASIINFLRNLKLLAIMVYSAILGSAYLRKFTPETLCYCRSMGYERLLDIYRPKASTQKALPTIVWFHGGAWKMGDRKAIERIAAEQLECGFALVSVSYSLSDVAQWPVQCHEAKAAIRFLRANAGALGLNPDKLIAAGMSAGAHMACILGVSSDHEQLNGQLGEHLEETTIYGPLCMNIDVLREAIAFPLLKKGDQFVIKRIGAYNMTQWMQFITYRPNVVMIDTSGKVHVIREKEKLENIIGNEKVPDHLKSH